MRLCIPKPFLPVGDWLFYNVYKVYLLINFFCSQLPPPYTEEKEKERDRETQR